jgi:hypothetical protein
MQKYLPPVLFLTIAMFFPQYVLAAPEDSANNVDACQNFSMDNPVTKNFPFVLNGKESQVSSTVYPGLVACLANLKKHQDDPGLTEAQAEDTEDKNVINNVSQNNYLHELVQNIQNITGDKNDQARIAINLVQGFPYEKKDKSTYDLPYVTLDQEKGICNETSKLILNLLKQMGFGTALLTFDKANHQAVGIKCDPQYSFENTGYCYVETTNRVIITDDTDLKEKPRVNVVSDEDTFDASTDYEDAQKYIELDKKKKLTEEEKAMYQDLQSKYGLEKKDKID